MGPGTYDPKDLRSSQSAMIKGRPSERRGDDIPGPGTYNEDPNRVRDRSRSANFGASPPRNSEKTWSPSREVNMGPGIYDQRDYTIGSGVGIAYTIPKNEKEGRDNRSPGPGHYKLPCKFADNPPYSNSGQLEEFKWV